MSWVGKLVGRATERQAARRTAAELVANLVASGEQVAERLARAADTLHNREVAAHIIGIERWSARRLRTALGDIAVRDEYDGYRPPVDQDMAALSAVFSEAREQSLALAEQAANLPESVTAWHNELGDLSVRGWLFYMAAHAGRESRRLRG